MEETDRALGGVLRRNPGLAVFLVVGFVMLMILVMTLIEGDTAAVSPDVRRRRYPLVHAEFERRFPPGSWSEGLHQYALDVDCPGPSNDLSATHSFQVSATLTSDPGHVYLRLKGPMVRKYGPDAVVTQFNPAESSSALVILELDPEEEAEDCLATIAWDGRGVQPLTRTHLYTIDVGGDW